MRTNAQQREQQVLDLLKDGKMRKTSDITSALGVSETSQGIRKTLSDLTERGVLHRTQEGRQFFYRLPIKNTVSPFNWKEYKTQWQ